MVKFYRKHYSYALKCMRITTLLFGIQACFATMLLASNLRAQSITLDVQKTHIKQIFTEIEKQADISFVYNDQIIRGLPSISIKATNKSLDEILKDISAKVPLQFKQSGKVIGVSRMPGKVQINNPAVIPSVNSILLIDIHGKVFDKDGNPITGVTIKIKGTSRGVATNPDGSYELDGIEANSVIIVSFIGFQTQEIAIRGISLINVVLLAGNDKLDEVQVIAYGTTTGRLTTGSIAKVNTEEIEEQPVMDPLGALEGRVAGLFVTQSSGLPGSAYNVQIRGQNSIASGTSPLYVIDGVPFSNSTLDEVFLGYPSQQSPFNSISPSDIENIEVLKDAAATSIYGSRGANGVILITTKKGKAGKTKVDIDLNSGDGSVTRMIPFMNTQQYVAMREDAFKNDNATINAASAPDLVLWDTTRYTNWEKMLIGGTAHSTNVHANISGGNEQTQFLIGADYMRQTTVFPGDFADARANVHLNLNHKSLDNKFSVSVTASYSNDQNNIIQSDLFGAINLPPDAPTPYGANGTLNWSQNGAYFNNPLAYLLQPYSAVTDNLIGNTNINYKIVKGLAVKVDAGYNFMELNQSALTPVDSQNPENDPVSYSNFGTSTLKSWIIEPQITYDLTIGKGKFAALMGGSEQQQTINGYNISTTDYSNDALLGSTSGAGSVTSSSTYSEYRYQAIFGRINYNWDNKYLVDLTGRRDGSSRFGPGKQYANFGAAGLAWIFSEESFVKDMLPFLSYGKLRSSYGITGNDQIGDYKYLNTWSPTYYSYQGVNGLQPSSLYNPDFAWEINKKLEGAIDIGFLKDRILLSVDYFRNRSSNQLVNYTLPGQTGFSGILENLPALVQNAGWEFNLNTINIHTGKFKWSTSINLTDAHNKLLAFPGLANSTYAHTYVIGQPLNILLLYHFIGVNPTTGNDEFNGTENPTDKTVVKDLTPKYYGGFSNTVTYQRFQLDFLFQFVKQLGVNYLGSTVADGYVGSEMNLPLQLLNSWQKPGDNKPYGAYTSGSNSQQVNAGYEYYPQSDAVVGDASFIRLKNVSLAYSLPETVTKFLKVDNFSVYLRAENLLTFTHYFGADPENQSSALPPLRFIIAGIKMTLK